MDDIVIAGISGRLPESDNLEEFWHNLFNGVDMVTEDDRRWKPGKKPSAAITATKNSRQLYRASDGEVTRFQEKAWR